MTAAPLERLDTLIQVAMRLARSAPTGRIALARLADAIDPLWIPRPWGDQIAAELEAARDASLEPLSARQVERTLRDAWGVNPTDELDELEPEPAAVTPTAQVHRGVLEGAPVAIKVLRPGLAAAVRQDLVILDGLSAPLAAAFPALDPRGIIAELRERILEELDLETEAESQRRFRRALRGHPFLSVPAPTMRLATGAVLVSEWVQGVKMRDAPDPDLAAARLLVFVIGAARTGMVHADPHPDDVLVVADGHLAILDFGVTRNVQALRVAAAAAALEAFAADDAVAFGEAAQALGWLPVDQAAPTLELARHALGELADPEPVRLDSAAVLRARDRLLDRPDALAALLQAGALPPPDLWPARGVAALFATIARVGATGRWLELARAAVRDGWNASV